MNMHLRDPAVCYFGLFEWSCTVRETWYEPIYRGIENALEAPKPDLHVAVVPRPRNGPHLARVITASTAHFVDHDQCVKAANPEWRGIKLVIRSSG